MSDEETSHISTIQKKNNSFKAYLQEVANKDETDKYFLSKYLKIDTSDVQKGIYDVYLYNISYISDSIISIIIAHTYTSVSVKFEIVTFDLSGNKLSSKFMFEQGEQELSEGETNYSEYSFVNNSIIEIIDKKINTIKKNGEFIDEILNETYRYYRIDKNGKIIEMSTNEHCSDNRKHKMFSVRIIEKEVLKKYSSDELRIIRNEIFADYGYIFKSIDLNKYFSEKDWYNPRYRDVSDKLSDVERWNIKIILENEK